MNRKIFLVIPIIVVIPLIVYSSSLEIEEKAVNINPEIEKPFTLNPEKDEKLISNSYLEITDEIHLFRIVVKEENVFEKDGEMVFSAGNIFPKPEFQEFYDEVGVRIEKQNTVVIYPIFTASAYQPEGFYDYYQKFCDESCLTTKIIATFDYNNSGIGIQVLLALGYEVVNDVYVHNNPEKLKDYDKVIVLHNEYVTKTEFNAITSHPKVMYLYPNAMYAEVEYFPDSNSITLIRGHNFPDKEIRNGFNWKFDNTHPFEFDNACVEWEFYEIDNGVMLNCYPENLIVIDKELLKAIKEF